MEIVIQNKLEPIIKELYNLVPSKFYLSTHFQKCCIKAGLEDDWDKAMRVAAYNRKYISIGTGFDDREDDADSAIRLTCNIAYQQGVENLLRYVVFLLDSYQSFSDQISIDTEELIDCFRIIGLTEEGCQRLKKYGHNGIHIGVSFPSNLLEDTERLQSLKEEIGKAIRNHEYNKANTYSYTLLEGLLKGYLSHFNISFDKNEDIEKYPKLIREDLKQRLGNSFVNEPHVVKQVSTITHIVSDLRNHGSDSHYDAVSDAVTACFVRDLTLSLANLLLNVVKEKYKD